MNIRSPNTASLFKDKTTLILRELLASPQFKWRVRSLATASHTSVGLVSRTISTLAQLYLVETGGLGRGGYIILKNADSLLDEWVQHYRFSQNTTVSYFLPAPKDIQKFYKALNQTGIRYALTLHSGANLLTRYFVTNHHYIYLDSVDVENLAIQLSRTVPIQRLAKGGNLHLISPYYKISAFDRMRMVRRMPVVSNLQLYLDLFHFMPRGHDHALQLRALLGDKLYE